MPCVRQAISCFPFKATKQLFLIDARAGGSAFFFAHKLAKANSVPFFNPGNAHPLHVLPARKDDTQKKGGEPPLDRLVELLKDGRNWSVEDLAKSLQAPQEVVQKQVETLEYNGYLRKACGCGPQCKGCGNCRPHRHHAPTFVWASPPQESP